MQVRMYVACGVSAIVALSVACSHGSSSPVSPAAGKVASTNAASAADGSTLKVSAPTLVSPVNDQEIDGQTATLVANAATGNYGNIALAYDFELYDDTGAKVRTEVVAGTTWVVAGLNFAGHYTWRVRATSDNAYGPWSVFGSFKTPDNRGYIRGNELFDPLTNGQSVATGANDVTFLPGQGVRLNSISSFIEWRLQTPLTDGQFSVTITNLSNSNEQWKTKVMSMLQGDGVNVTDNAYRFTADRRNKDSGGAVRYTLRSRGVDAGEPNCGTQGWDRTHIYLWTYTWTGGASNINVRDGGPQGATIKSCGASYRAPYSPNPHVIRLGSVGGRGGDESLPQAIFRNIWVSSAARPVFPGDTP